MFALNKNKNSILKLWGISKATFGEKSQFSFACIRKHERSKMNSQPFSNMKRGKWGANTEKREEEEQMWTRGERHTVQAVQVKLTL